MMKHLKVLMAMALCAAMLAGTNVLAQAAGQKPPAKPPVQNGGTAKPAPPAPPKVEEFVLGAGDLMQISVFNAPEMSGAFVIRPDGKISMLQIGDVQAAGLKPEELKTKIKTELKRFYEDPVPEVFVEIKAMPSRVVYVQGAVNRTGAIPVVGELRMVQLITLAGGFQEFADKKKILVISGTQKKPNGDPVTWIVNYEDLVKLKNLQKNNILLNPGDTVIVGGG